MRTKHFAFEFLPPYSPFLNIVEEVNRDIKVGVWRKNTVPGGTIDCSIMTAEVTLIEELEKVKPEMLMKYVGHMLKFLEMSKNKQPIYQKDLCEKSHPGDDSLFCPEFSEEMEAKLEEEMNEVLDRHLPKDYFPYTFDAHQQENAPLTNLDYISMHNSQDFLVNRERMKAETAIT